MAVARRIKQGRCPAAIAVVLAALCGCNRDVRLAGHKLRDVNVGTVTHYGITLDQEASPEQVAFVLLRAIREDFEAEDEASRQAALDKQLDLCAADEISALHAPDMDRSQAVYKLVHRWTPTVAHYVHDFDTEWEKARTRLTLLGPKPSRNSKSGAMESQVVVEVKDPTGDPNANTLLVVGLIQDSGYWRVMRIGFAPTKRSLK